MFELCLLVILAIFLISCFMTRTILHPATLTSVLWLFLIIVYNFVEHPLFELSPLFYKALLLWVVPFCLFSLVFGRISFPCFACLKNKYCNDALLDRFYVPIFLSLTLLILLFCYQASSIGFGNIMSNYRAYAMNNLFESQSLYERILLYSLNISLVFILAKLLYSKDNSKCRKWTFLLILLLLVFLIKSEKFNIIILFSFLICYFLKNKKIFMLIFGAVLSLIFLILLSVFRADANLIEYDYLKFIQIYLLSHMTAFDSVLLGDTRVYSNVFGEFTFNMFTRIFYGNQNDLFSLNRFVNVPLPTNVFTVMFHYYVDFGYTGILCFSILMGMLFGCLYSFFKRNIGCFCLLYPFMYFLIIVQFFMDILSLLTFRWIQYILLSIFCFLKYSNKSMK